MAQMKALDIHEHSLCPGCLRPIDVCANDTHPVGVDKHVCNFELAKAVQMRMDEHDHRNDEPPTYGQPKWDDGVLHAPRPSTAEELATYSI